MSEELKISEIRRDEELQPRARLDEGLLRQYEDLTRDGVKLAPVTVFCDALGVHWLADGYHRVAVRMALDLPTVAADILDGDRHDALVYSLSANARHGKPREPGDFRRSYEIGVRNGVVKPDDVKAVATMLKCSRRTAEVLTQATRAEAEEQRQKTVVAAREAGEPLARIAEDLDIAPSTVSRIAKRAMSGGGERAKPGRPKAKADQPGDSKRMWQGVLAALRAIMELPSPDDLFANWDGAIEDRVGQEIGAAREWIEAVDERFKRQRTQAA